MPHTPQKKAAPPAVPLTKYNMQEAMEALYAQRSTKEDLDEGDRSLCRSISKQYGLRESDLRAAVNSLPAGLENSAARMTLHTNRHLDIIDLRATYTLAELQSAVLHSFEPGVGPTRAQRLGTDDTVIGKTTMAKHRKALLAHRKKHVARDKDYFSAILPRGRPTKLTPDEEDAFATRLALQNKTAGGSNRQGTDPAEAAVARGRGDGRREPGASRRRDASRARRGVGDSAGFPCRLTERRR